MLHHNCKMKKKARCNLLPGFLSVSYVYLSNLYFYPFKASAPPTISRISPVIAACLALL